MMERDNSRNALSHSGGRAGARNAFSRTFMDVIAADFAQHGKDAVEMLRQERPHDYLKLLSTLLPKELPSDVPTVEDMTDDEFTSMLNAVRSLVTARGSEPGGDDSAR